MRGSIAEAQAAGLDLADRSIFFPPAATPPSLSIPEPKCVRRASGGAFARSCGVPAVRTSPCPMPSDGGGEAALRQCELLQNMIDISLSSLQGLRTKCAASNDLTQHEIRTLEVTQK